MIDGFQGLGHDTVIRGDDVLVPGGNFQFQKGDTCLVFTLSESLPELESMFRGKG